MGDRGSRLSLKIHKNTGFLSKLSNTGPDPLKNHKATKPAAMLGHHWPPAMAFGLQADDGPFIVIFGSSITSSKKKVINLDPV